MTFFQAFILGLIQGTTEFLPVSSSAHLILVPWIFHWPDPGLSYDVALHWGTLLGVIAYFWKDVLTLLHGWLNSFQGKREFENQLPWMVLVSTVPGALSGFLLEKQAETLFRSPWLIAVMLMGLGFLLFVADRRTVHGVTLPQISFSTAFIIGMSQALAIIPGVSRSGITISVALLMGMERTAAVRFSFLLSIPIIAGAGLLKINFLWENLSSPIFLMGIASAALSGFLAISFLINYVKARTFTPFVVYRFILAVITLFLIWHPL